MSSNEAREGSPRALYLELSALGIDLRTGAVPELRGLTCADIAALMRQVGESRAGLREVFAGDGGDLEAIRREGS